MNRNRSTGKRREIRGRSTGTFAKLISHKLGAKPGLALLGGLAVVATITIMTPVAVGASVPTTKTDFVATTEQPLLDQAIGGRCIPPAAKDILRSYRLKIATAPTVEEARELIFSQTRLAAKALSAASWILPFSASVREAREKIERLEKRVYAANTQTEVAKDFSDFLVVPAQPDSYQIVAYSDESPIILASSDLDDSAVSVSSDSGHGCNYTTGEIIIIVLGFILFIIPGIIFLIIFC